MSETITFTIQSIRPPKDGQKSGRITTTDGTILWLWAAKLGLIKEGATYEAQAEQNGTFTNLKTVKQISGPVVPFAAPAASQQPAATGAPSIKDEQIFVVALLKSLIESGELKNDKTAFWTTTQMLRGLYKHTFGFDAINQHLREAAE